MVEVSAGSVPSYESLATSDECLGPKNPSTLNTKMSGGIFGEGMVAKQDDLGSKKTNLPMIAPKLSHRSILPPTCCRCRWRW